MSNALEERPDIRTDVLGYRRSNGGLARFRAIPGDEERGDHVPRGDGESGSQYIRIFLELASTVFVFI